MAPGSHSSESPSDKEIHLTEWETARDVLQACDNNLHDLRKYGFTFVTALLAAESILLPPGSSANEAVGVPDNVKLGVFLVTLLLIYVLHLIDENYAVLEEAAAKRALVLEQELNIELTDVITDRYNKNKVKRRVLIVYLLFAVGVFALGYFVFMYDPLYIYALGIGTFVAAGTMVGTRRSVKLEYRFGEGKDWTIEPLECTRGDHVRITLTNLDTTPVRDLEALAGLNEKPKPEDLTKAKSQKVPQPIVYDAGQRIWQIEDEQGRCMGPDDSYTAKMKMWIYYSYTWLWDTKDVEPGVYRVHPLERLLPLERKIIISGKETPPKEERKDRHLPGRLLGK